MQEVRQNLIQQELLTVYHLMDLLILPIMENVQHLQAQLQKQLLLQDLHWRQVQVLKLSLL